MVNFRLPDFRFLRIFRDRQQKTTDDDDDASRPYPEPASIPDAWWRQSQSRSRQYPVYFSAFIFMIDRVLSLFFYHFT